VLERATSKVADSTAFGHPGKLVFRVLFDHADLPDATEEAAQVQQSLATALS
tara:strand:+ start:690 stop:845 length:156 start_codon:yes stop_codon:yes gene_type:complete